MRLIDADALIAEVGNNINTYWNEAGGGYYLAEDALNESIRTAPTVDAVEVVRCCECKSRPKGEYRMCHKLCRQTHEDDFCSYGERRDTDEH